MNYTQLCLVGCSAGTDRSIPEFETNPLYGDSVRSEYNKHAELQPAGVRQGLLDGYTTSDAI